MSTNFPLKYRSLDELIDSIRIDMRVYSGESQIEMQELIKIAQKCNYELGLQIHQTKETILDVEHSRSKLPADFYFLNFALLCHDYEIVQPNLFAPLTKIDTPYPLPAPNYTTCPCWTVTNPSDGDIQIKFTACDGTQVPLTIVRGTTIKLCANSIPNPSGILELSTGSFCYNDPSTGEYTCNQPTTCGCTTPVHTCGQPNPDPWHQNCVYSLCDNTIGVQVIQQTSNTIRRYRDFEMLTIVPSRKASAFLTDSKFKDAPHQAQIKDGFLHTSIQCGKVYFNYEGVLENEDGELLVLDHPLINEYYEWAIKERILENLYINGEPDIERRLQLVQNKLKIAKMEAMTVAYTPDFQQMRNSFKISRNKAMQRYMAPFSRYFGGFNLSWLDQVANGRYAE